MYSYGIRDNSFSKKRRLLRHEKNTYRQKINTFVIYAKKVFQQTEDLCRHKASTHFRSTEEQCSKCRKTFTRADNLKRNKCKLVLDQEIACLSDSKEAPSNVAGK